MSRVTDGKFCNSRNFRAAACRFEVVRQLNLRHEDRRAAPSASRAKPSCPAMPMPSVARQNLRRRAQNSGALPTTQDTSPRPIASSAPLRSKRSSRRAVAPRQCALPSRVAAKKQARAVDFPRRRRRKKTRPSSKSRTLFAPARIFRSSAASRPGIKTRPQRDMIFAQRIAQLDRVP